MKTKPICTECKGDDLALEVTSAYWDVEEQRLNVGGDLCDKGHYCNSCDAERSIEWVDVPSIHHPKNIERATWARNALEVFTRETFGGSVPEKMHAGDRASAIQDLITDLMHYLNQNPCADDVIPHDIEDVHGRALRLYYEELATPEF